MAAANNAISYFRVSDVSEDRPPGFQFLCGGALRSRVGALQTSPPKLPGRLLRLLSGPMCTSTSRPITFTARTNGTLQKRAFMLLSQTFLSRVYRNANSLGSRLGQLCGPVGFLEPFVSTHFRGISGIWRVGGLTNCAARLHFRKCN